MPKKSNILCIGDLHSPHTLDGYLEFCKELEDRYECNKVIFMGDIIDNHYSSYHESDPDGLGAKDELDLAIDGIQEWSEAFPKADVVTGNHDLIIMRKALSGGIPSVWLKSMSKVLGVKWKFAPSFTYNSVLYRHGTGMKIASRLNSDIHSTVQGHYHTESKIIWKVGHSYRIFGMQVGCGIDKDSYAMAYAKDFPKPVISCGVVLDNGKLPILELMDL